MRLEDPQPTARRAAPWSGGPLHGSTPADGDRVRVWSVPIERPREDALPEHVDYRDSGCDLFPSCLRCPLPRCRYDEQGGVRAVLNRQRDREIRRMRHDTPLTVAQIAKHFRVSRRTVFRALADGRPRERGARPTDAAADGGTGTGRCRGCEVRRAV